MILGIVITLIILALGIFTVGVSMSFMLKPTEVKLCFIRPLSVATTYASIVGVVIGLAVTLSNISWELEGGKGTPLAALFLGGISEALIPAITGFSLLTVAWVAVSLGMRKHI
ncbi:MAG: hypothetical protein JXO51_11040 [Candidatus Aminicenantes bacterium]|nr:hypothetical protein [Candidatus Aminicenantes bacterium]